MAPPEVRELGEGRLLLDLDFRDTEGLVAAYLIPAESGWTLIETGPTTCRPALLVGLSRAGVSPEEVDRVFVTHIHLDHAGGVGALATDLPRARFFAHAAGTPHLIDPTKLIASARRAWGAAADPLWGPIAPAPADRLTALHGGERFPVSGGALEVLATPGHAKHHLAFFDDRVGALFTGDGAGVRLEGSPHLRPAVPPPDLDLAQLFASLSVMRAREPRLVLLSHFGPSPDGRRDLVRYEEIVRAWEATALSAAREQPQAAYVAQRLAEADARTLQAERATPSVAERASLVSGYDLAAQGFLRYFQTHGLIAQTDS